MSESVAPEGAPSGRRLRVALLASYLSDEYEWSIVKGARDVVEASGGSLLCFAGGALADPDPERRARNFVLEALNPELVDGILSISSCVDQYLGQIEGAAWLGRFGLPVVSVGELPGVTSVGIQDSEGITQLMDHLVAHHGHRRIAFIAGTGTNAEALERREAYLAALEHHGIPLDERLLLSGDFTRESGARAVFELFDARQVPVEQLDAIVASNDYMAFGAIDELSRRRIAVPDQVAVVGFDDMELARIFDPPLTTVRQPLAQLGREAARRLLAVLGGAEPEPSVTLETELFLRRSCGCVPTDIPPPPDAPFGGDRATAEMLSGLMAEVRGEQGAFARALDPLLRRLAQGNARQLEQNRRLADELATRLRVASEDLVHDRLHRLARALELRMFGPQAQLSHVLAERMPELGIEGCVVSELTGAEGELKVAFGFDAHTHQPQMVPFLRERLVPEALDGLLEKSAFVLALKYGEEPLGVAVLCSSDRNGTSYETLAEVFGIVLKALQVRRRAEVR